ncbi:diguanylate cyclase (GGDEF) domain-containing protein [Sediminibacillus albus]|uniref:Diguanylate cyclase (GGDEF) domain-containing protein n=2 Tax=Sediminibacillus albus TaxID=407036 RepID=A0A1G8WCL2_9BACI|nr:diguanylate cyclase (GGDEF) domain-containing protein [Sediminibacillus albus]
MSLTPKEEKLPIHYGLLEHLQDAILIVDENGLIIDGNAPAFKLLGMSSSQPYSINDFFDFNSMKDKEKTIAIHKQNKSPYTNYQIKSFCISAEASSAKPIYVLILQQELTETTAAVKSRIGQWTNLSEEGLVLFDGESIIDCDPTFARIFGISINSLKCIPVSELFLEDSETLFTETSLPSTYRFTGVRGNRSQLHLELRVMEYPLQGRVIRAALVQDVTDRVENERKIEYTAYYDELTDLPNRNYFNKVLKDAIEETGTDKENLAVYFVDLDYFKQVNDTLGYSFGDELLKACGRKLKGLLDEATFAARMGGDEFLLLQKGYKTRKEVEAYAQLIIDAFEQPIFIEEYEIYITVSIGISLYPYSGITVNELIKQADSAMYVTKEKYRNNYKVYDSSITENFKEMLSLELELRKALKEEQFELHYQPQKDIQTGEIVGFEALLRWDHPTKGYIPPSKFIPLAEKTGLIIDIGEWVLREACLQNKKWHDQGCYQGVVGVNLSAKQFHQKDLAGKIRNILKETGLNAEYLELEITESAAMTNEESILDTLLRLRDLGVHVSIDDFGTGYSSLKYLSLFPISKLKIDKLFISDNQTQNQAIVKSIIHMSHSLKMKVIAEGVETKEQLLFLQNEKCDEIQGFYFYKPLPLKEADSLLARIQ